MRLAEQWHTIESELPAGWVDLHLRAHVSDPKHANRAAALLGPVTPLKRGTTLDMHVTPTSKTRYLWLLERLDREQIGGRLEFLHAESPVPATARAQGMLARLPLASAWDLEASKLPGDWSDLLVDVELESSDQIASASLHLAPCNAARNGNRGLRFRVARRTGYGAAPTMVRRCLERLDADDIRGAVEIRFAMSDTDHVSTQGPVWYVGGKVL